MSIDLGDSKDNITHADLVTKVYHERLSIRRVVEEILDANDFTRALKIVKQGVRDNAWLREAYISYYRGRLKVSLFNVTGLDWINIEVFGLICSLRKIQGWSDQDLFELESFAKSLG
ncbi:hypothetical protein QN400_21255 [Pseudomonas sp. RTC3]|uniref:hypothetical protein n=1 Tax=Pseudomonas sp. 5C2 TaxID=3048588 RepID=UPI002AB47EE8|nr:hypothetical protein [Pseudomonas sp. 5C2]MDY7567483.1 hypothetical protein [Pseudomonas sp. 5C2]MEB0064545.1 hypothetical protein [Pseudomonas sp. RTC3]MEB0243047.1 hypothetical protein [Pseudomonas sp. 5C2]